MITLTAIIAVKFPTLHWSNLVKTLNACLNLNTQVIVILDTNLYGEIFEECNSLTTLGAEVIVGNFQNPGESRNRGLNIARGDWVVFWDVDDQPNVSEVLGAISDHFDFEGVLIGDFTLLEQGSNQEQSKPVLSSVSDISPNPGIWRMVFKRHILDGIYFPSYSLGEDQVFLAKVFLNHPSYKLIYRNFYQYKIGVQDQLTSVNVKKNKITDRFLFATEIYQKSLMARHNCFLCTSIRRMNIRSNLSCLLALGLSRKVDGVGFFRARMRLFLNLLHSGVLEIFLSINQKIHLCQ